jgi:hypothetical protein
VRTIEPHTESDPVALLLQFLVAFGNVIGRGPHFRAEADRHATNLFAVLVGTTSKGRKGTSWTLVRTLVAGSDAFWDEHCVQTGLSSGEGLIYAVRDASDGDAGALDKRLLVIESEFSSPLRMIGRDGNTLSPVVRQAWDGTPLQVMTKISPAKATGAHVSLIAHVTRDELRRELTRTDAGNGFGNRFLWACVHRSKALPDGGRVPEEHFEQLTSSVNHALKWADSLGDHELRRDQDASALWHSEYPCLSEGKPGLFGAVTSRAEAQVMRLACLYALLDQSREVRRAHLLAALTVWRYCEASAEYIFDGTLGHPVADALLRILRRSQKGMTRTEISNFFGHNRSRADIGGALAFLSEVGLAAAQAEETGGRPVERWYATTTTRSPWNRI